LEAEQNQFVQINTEVHVFPGLTQDRGTYILFSCFHFTVGKRQLYYGLSSDEFEVNISLAKHTLDFLTQKYLKCKNESLTAQEIDQCSRAPCANGATCKGQLNSFQCVCLPGFTGKLCENDIDECASNPCTAGSTCQNRHGHFVCACPAGFAGNLCQHDIDECASNPCTNGSTCQNRHGHFECVCPAGFAGNLCQFDISECSSRPCQKGGTCVDLVNGYRCICPDGHYGKHCEEVDHCRSQPCQNGATCVNGTTTYNCICPESVYGKNCEKGTKCLPGGSIRIGNTSMVFQYSPAKYSSSSWMKDSHPTDLSSSNKVWFFKGNHNKVVVAFDTLEDMKLSKQNASNTITLPYYWIGNGQVVYRNNLYFQSYRTKNIVKYDLQKMKILIEEEIKDLDSGTNNNYCYNPFGPRTMADFAVDEFGLWLVYGNVTDNCNLVIAKINPDTLKVENSWTTTIYSRTIGDTFMKCGVLYCAASYTSSRNYIRYTYDTSTGKQEMPSSRDGTYQQPSSRNSMLNYNPHDGLLYYADYRMHPYSNLATFQIAYSV
ncbi:neurogenic locus Notch protein, partial [Lingula anatina]|uniref:Neurogenic locus Notch protein n=1 Tax=Lingula anatina TaxID=7574 RepID=A0A2R2MLL8_LINAN